MTADECIYWPTEACAELTRTRAELQDRQASLAATDSKLTAALIANEGLHDLCGRLGENIDELRAELRALRAAVGRFLDTPVAKVGRPAHNQALDKLAQAVGYRRVGWTKTWGEIEGMAGAPWRKPEGWQP